VFIMAIAEVGSPLATQLSVDQQAEPDKKAEALAVVGELAANGDIPQEDADFFTAALTSTPDPVTGEVAVQYKGNTLFMGNAFIDKLSTFLTDAKKLDGENSSAKLNLNIKIVEISQEIADNMVTGAMQNFAIVATSSTVASVMVFGGMARAGGSSAAKPDGKGGDTQPAGGANANGQPSRPYGVDGAAGNSDADGDGGVQLNTTIVGNALIQLGGAAGNFANTFFQADNTELEAAKSFIMSLLNSDGYTDSARQYSNY
jgi:hypothetical protein